MRKNGQTILIGLYLGFVLLVTGGTTAWAQGFHAVSRVTPMAPARGVFFGVQGIGPRPKFTPTVTTYRGPGPVAQGSKPKTANGSGSVIDPQVLAGIRNRAIRGSAVDQYRMGLLFVRGQLGERDLRKAERWIAIAAARNYAPAIAALKRIREITVAENYSGKPTVLR